MDVSFDSLFSGLLAPLVVVLILGITAYVVPSVRWARALKRDAEILGGLPQGQEREAWEEGVEAQAARLRLHRKETPVWEQAAGWLVVAYLLLLTYRLLLGLPVGTPNSTFEWIATLVGALVFAWVGWRTLRGWPFLSLPSEDFKAAARRARVFVRGTTFKWPWSGRTVRKPGAPPPSRP